MFTGHSFWKIFRGCSELSCKCGDSEYEEDDDNDVEQDLPVPQRDGEPGILGSSVDALEHEHDNELVDEKVADKLVTCPVMSGVTQLLGTLARWAGANWPVQGEVQNK